MRGFVTLKSCFGSISHTASHRVGFGGFVSCCISHLHQTEAAILSQQGIGMCPLDTLLTTNKIRSPRMV